MQKSKNITILIIIFLIIYFFINQMFFSKFGNVYTFVINPISFIGIAIIFRIFMLSPYNTNKFRKDIIQYVFITMFSYAIIYLILGIFTKYGKNPYSSTLRGLVINIFVYASVFCSIEYIRYKLIHNVYNQDVNIVFVIIVIAFSIWDLKLFNVLENGLTVYSGFKFLFYNFVPVVIKNVLFTYITLKADYFPTIIYNFIYYFILWIPPILPKAPWVAEAMFNTFFPLLLLLYIRYYVAKKDRFQLNKVYAEKSPGSLILFCTALIVLILFALGVFPIKPVGVATASMYPQINVGDAVVIKKCNANDVSVQDIIEYQMEGYTVIHRVISKYQKDGEYFFITKGDNNQDEDTKPVSEEQLIGKVIFKVPYIALPTIWLHSVQSQEAVEVETGS